MAVGFDGWAKGGDVNDYSAAIVVSPKAQLGIVVIGASGFGSTRSSDSVATRMLVIPQCGFSAGGERSWLHDTFWRPRAG
ncbi:MAG: hypothetical protein D4R79_05990 [Comamonadaceae bacterium]|jgi:hypothetical protein|nr:MAG: hypothetical protein D4R79_05990 [Comamonadaceae bacterium]